MTGDVFKPIAEFVSRLETSADQHFNPDNYAEFSGVALLLSISLEAAVPLHWAELEQERRGMDEDDFWDSLQQTCRVASQLVAEKGDRLMFRGRGKEKGETAQVFNALARSLACMAYTPGGVTFLGCHWQRVRERRDITE